MKEFTVQTYWAKIYIGSVRGYNGSKFFDHDVIAAIGEFQKRHEAERILDAAELVSVTVTNTTYVVRDYVEDGFEIAAINYPRFPKTNQEIFVYIHALAEFLLNKFEQNRLSLVTPLMTYTFEKDNPEEHPKPIK